MYNKIITY